MYFIRRKNGGHLWMAATSGILALMLVGATCRNRPSPEAESLGTKSFIGPWEAQQVDVSITSKNGSGGPDQIHFDSKELAAHQGRRPALTVFNGDGSYREETFNLQDSLVQSKAGFWHYYEDSLYMRLDVEGSPKIAFRAELHGKGLLLRSQMDWDGDGSRDDEMVVALKRP